MSWKDVATLDSHRHHFLENLASMSEADLEQSGLTFVHSESDSLTIEQMPGGADVKLK